jgi:hypothetical protein
MRMSAPSMAPTPVTSSMTPTLIGVPLGAAAAPAEVEAGAAGVVAAGLAHAARTQASPPTQVITRGNFGRINVHSPLFR